MKKLVLLLTVATVVSSVTGCGVFRRLRDCLCRGAQCGPTAIAAPPMVMGPPVAACPPAYDPGCGYPGGVMGDVQTLGYGGGYDSGWVSGCDSCNGGSYALPGGNGGYLMDSAGGAGGALPGPATIGE